MSQCRSDLQSREGSADQCGGERSASKKEFGIGEIFCNGDAMCVSKVGFVLFCWFSCGGWMVEGGSFERRKKLLICSSVIFLWMCALVARKAGVYPRNIICSSSGWFAGSSGLALNCRYQGQAQAQDRLVGWLAGWLDLMNR